MVNADKHRRLKVLNQLTKNERNLNQFRNRRKRYKDNAYKVNAECNFNQFKDLEELYNKYDF